MADAPNTVTTFAGFLKTVYAKNVVNTVPEDYILQRDIKFRPPQRIGEQYQQSVITKWEQGGTYKRGGQGDFALHDAQAGSIEKALVDGYQFVLKSGIDYETLSKAISKGKLAYGSSGDQLLRNMSLSTRKRLEIDLWVGQFSKGIGEIESVNGAAYTITEATWAPGFWVGMEGAIIDAFASSLTSERDAGNDRVLASVDLDTRTVTMDVAHASVQQGDILFFNGQRETGAWNSMLGLIALGNTTGQLWTINTATRSTFQPNRYPVGGQLTFSKVQNGALRSKVKGLSMGSGATVYCSIYSWNDLLTEQAAMRRYGGSFSGRTKLTNGGTAIEFWSLVGRLTIKPSVYCPIGYAVIVPSGKLRRVGSTDVTFSIPGFNDTPNLHIPDNRAGISLRSYYNQALFTECPGQVTLMTGITSSAA